MEQSFALGAWPLLFAALCILSWVLGAMHGANRTRSLLAHNDIPGDGIPGVEPVVVPALSPAPAAIRKSSLPDARTIRSAHSPRADLACPAQELSNLQKEMRVIRSASRIWDDPEFCRELLDANPAAGCVLSRYEKSIDSLQQSRPHSPGAVGTGQ